MSRKCQALFVLTAALFTAQCARSQQQSLTPAAIFKFSKAAVAKVLAYDQMGKLLDTGTGFVIDPSGIILTAGHVVSPPALAGEPLALRYYSKIQVLFPGRSPIDVIPVTPPNPQESIVDDYAILRIRTEVATRRFPYLKLGDGEDIDVGGQLTSLGYALDSPVPLLVTGIVSAKIPIRRPFSLRGKNLASNAILFQGAANPGASGGPLISDESGKVVGIVTERLVGLGAELQKARQQIIATEHQGSVTILGVNPNQTELGLINALDRYLSNGMGAAISIDYAKRAWLSISNAQH